MAIRLYKPTSPARRFMSVLTYEEITKKALETVFPNIKVKSVNTLRTEGKIKRQGMHAGRTPEVKKAYVTLTEDSKPIEFFEGMI